MATVDFDPLCLVSLHLFDKLSNHLRSHIPWWVKNRVTG